MPLHGISRDAWTRYGEGGSWYYEVVAPGFKYNMPDLAAAIGLHQLARAEEFRAARQRLAERYTEAFEPLEEIETPAVLPEREHAWHLYGIPLRLERPPLPPAPAIQGPPGPPDRPTLHLLPIDP